MNNPNNPTIQLWELPILMAGVSFSVILRLALPETYMHWDVWTFIDWTGYAEPIRSIYDTACYCNYPIVGILFSAGLLKFLSGDIFHFLLSLAVIDLVNVLLVFAVFRAFKVQYAALFAGVFGLLPAVWAGGGLWGQIDNAGLMLSLVFILMCARFFGRNEKTGFFQIALLGIVYALILLSKQLMIFSLVPFGLMILWLIWNEAGLLSKSAIGKAAVFTAAVFLVVILFDLWLVLPENYSLSHLQRVFYTGSDHMNKISGNGFNLWILLRWEDKASSDLPFWLGISPKTAGLTLFLSNLFLLAWICFRNSISKPAAAIVVEFLFFTALVNLAFNLFLSGTHERYLYHFYPLLWIVAVVRHREWNLIWQRWIFLLTIVGSIIYGLYVIGVFLEKIGPDTDLVLLSFHFLFYVVLVRLFYTEGRSYLIRNPRANQSKMTAP